MPRPSLQLNKDLPSEKRTFTLIQVEMNKRQRETGLLEFWIEVMSVQMDWDVWIKEGQVYIRQLTLLELAFFTSLYSLTKSGIRNSRGHKPSM